MFDKKTKNDTNLLGNSNRIVEGTSIEGNIQALANTQIDGTLIGDFTTKGKLVIGPSGKIKGNITCKNCDVEGQVQGKIMVEETLNLKQTALIHGDVFCGKLSVEPGATLNGSCLMSNVNHTNEPVTEKNK